MAVVKQGYICLLEEWVGMGEIMFSQQPQFTIKVLAKLINPVVDVQSRGKRSVFLQPVYPNRPQK